MNARELLNSLNEEIDFSNPNSNEITEDLRRSEAQKAVTETFRTFARDIIFDKEKIVEAPEVHAAYTVLQRLAEVISSSKGNLESIQLSDPEINLLFKDLTIETFSLEGLGSHKTAKDIVKHVVNTSIALRENRINKQVKL